MHVYVFDVVIQSKKIQCQCNEWKSIVNVSVTIVIVVLLLHTNYLKVALTSATY